MITRVDPQANLFGSRFQLTNGMFQPGLIITDYQWWTDNESAINEWMSINLPRGVEHRMGTMINFETEQDRLSFLMRWS